MFREKPVIAVTPLWDVGRESIWMLPAYVKALEDQGAIPLILPLTDDRDILDWALEGCDGLLLTGGQDVDPRHYGEEPHPKLGELAPVRDGQELYLIPRALEQDLPLFGICRGEQILNVALGGSLYQDLPSQLPQALSHSMKPPYDRGVHRVSLVPESPLGALLEVEQLSVNSRHHQGIKALAPGLEVMAVAEDGLVEAVRVPGKTFAWAVQWHPEHAYEADGASRALFGAFVAACRG